MKCCLLAWIVFVLSMAASADEPRHPRRISVIQNDDYHLFLWKSYHYLNDVFVGQPLRDFESQLETEFEESNGRYRRKEPLKMNGWPVEFGFTVRFGPPRQVGAIYPYIRVKIESRYSSFLKRSCFIAARWSSAFCHRRMSANANPSTRFSMILR